MTGTLTSLRNPVWANAEHTAVDCEITISSFGNEVLPFTASLNDVAAHGRAIFADIVAGKYGDIAAYTPIDAPLQPLPTATIETGVIPTVEL